MFSVVSVCLLLFNRQQWYHTGGQYDLILTNYISEDSYFQRRSYSEVPSGRALLRNTPQPRAAGFRLGGGTGTHILNHAVHAALWGTHSAKLFTHTRGDVRAQSGSCPQKADSLHTNEVTKEDKHPCELPYAVETSRGRGEWGRGPGAQEVPGQAGRKDLNEGSEEGQGTACPRQSMSLHGHRERVWGEDILDYFKNKWRN